MQPFLIYEIDEPILFNIAVLSVFMKYYDQHSNFNLILKLSVLTCIPQICVNSGSEIPNAMFLNEIVPFP